MERISAIGEVGIFPFRGTLPWAPRRLVAFQVISVLSRLDNVARVRGEGKRKVPERTLKMGRRQCRDSSQVVIISLILVVIVALLFGPDMDRGPLGVGGIGFVRVEINQSKIATNPSDSVVLQE